MSEKETLKIMNDTVKPIMRLIESRLNNSIDALSAIASSSLDNVPEVVQKMREEEASKVRAVIKEQKDLLSILKVMHPDA